MPDRTTAPASPLPSEAFTYDGVGNRLTSPDPGDAYTYNAGHQLLTGPGATYTYDASGNRATKTDATGTTTYTWDAVERLVEAVVTTGSGTTTVSFAYDALGRRIARSVVVTPVSGPVVTTTTTYVYDGEDIIWIEETSDTSGSPVTTTTRVVHGPGIDEPLLVETGGQVLAVHADGLGSVTGLTDASQTLVEARAYTAFGQMQRTGNWPELSYAYTGREWEPELELYYYRARYYDPEAGRFLSRDPIGFEGGDPNLYGYAAEDPTNHRDPWGLETRGRYRWCGGGPMCRTCTEWACGWAPGYCCQKDFDACLADTLKYPDDSLEREIAIWRCLGERAACRSGAGLPSDPPEQWNGRDPKGYGDPFPGPVGRPPKVPNRDDKPWQGETPTR